MSRFCSTKLGSMLIALVLIFSILALCFLGGGSVAWFASKSDVSASGMGVQVEHHEVVENVEFFQILSVTPLDNGNIYTFSATPLEKNAPKLLESFSPIDSERQLLMKITLTGATKQVQLRATSETEEYLGVDLREKISQAGNSLSSVIEFYPFANATLTDGNYVLTTDELLEDPTAFASISEGGTASYNDSVLIHSYSAEDLAKSEHCLYIVLDYYEASVQYIMDSINALLTSGDITNIEMGENITFTCDFKFAVSE